MATTPIQLLQIYFLFEKNNYNLTVVGLPKTIDNDIYPIKQTLGGWTAAEQGAIFFENIINENTTSEKQLIIHEIMGRNCGWLTAATALKYRERLSKKVRKRIRHNKRKMGYSCYFTT